MIRTAKCVGVLCVCACACESHQPRHTDRYLVTGFSKEGEGKEGERVKNYKIGKVMFSGTQICSTGDRCARLC